MSTRLSGMIEWNPAYSIDVPSIDSQHRLLVSIIRQLQEAMLQGKVKETVVPLFGALNQYTKFHFEYEEQLLREHGYSSLESHQMSHAGLIRKLQEIQDQYTAGTITAGGPLMQFLRNWLFDHIGSHDRQYAPFLREKGVL